jgi:cobalt-zinc-cadmium efflux system protein
MSHHHESFASHGGLDRRLWASAALNAAITLAEFVGGILSGSLALLSDATHNLSDVATASSASRLLPR